MCCMVPDYVSDLLYPFTTSEPYPDRRGRHTVRHPALLDQLNNTLTGSTTAGDPVRSQPGARPAGRMDVLAFLERLDKQSAVLAAELGLSQHMPLRSRLSALSGKLGLVEHTLVRSWWTTARVLTSFDSPAFSPDVPCPDCGRRGALRVRIHEREDERAAVCIECHHVWDGPHFGMLAMWIRHASDARSAVS